MTVGRRVHWREWSEIIGFLEEEIEEGEVKEIVSPVQFVATTVDEQNALNELAEIFATRGKKPAVQLPPGFGPIVKDRIRVEVIQTEEQSEPSIHHLTSTGQLDYAAVIDENIKIGISQQFGIQIREVKGQISSGKNELNGTQQASEQFATTYEEKEQVIKNKAFGEEEVSELNSLKEMRERHLKEKEQKDREYREKLMKEKQEREKKKETQERKQLLIEKILEECEDVETLENSSSLIYLPTDSIKVRKNTIERKDVNATVLDLKKKYEKLNKPTPKNVEPSTIPESVQNEFVKIKKAQDQENLRLSSKEKREKERISQKFSKVSEMSFEDNTENMDSTQQQQQQHQNEEVMKKESDVYVKKEKSVKAKKSKQEKRKSRKISKKEEEEEKRKMKEEEEEKRRKEEEEEEEKRRQEELIEKEQLKTKEEISQLDERIESLKQKLTTKASMESNITEQTQENEEDRVEKRRKIREQEIEKEKEKEKKRQKEEIEKVRERRKSKVKEEENKKKRKGDKDQEKDEVDENEEVNNKKKSKRDQNKEYKLPTIKALIEHQNLGPEVLEEVQIPKERKEEKKVTKKTTKKRESKRLKEEDDSEEVRKSRALEQFGTPEVSDEDQEEEEKDSENEKQKIQKTNNQTQNDRQGEPKTEFGNEIENLLGAYFGGNSKPTTNQDVKAEVDAEVTEILSEVVSDNSNEAKKAKERTRAKRKMRDEMKMLSAQIRMSRIYDELQIEDIDDVDHVKLKDSKPSDDLTPSKKKISKTKSREKSGTPKEKLRRKSTGIIPPNGSSTIVDDEECIL